MIVVNISTGFVFLRFAKIPSAGSGSATELSINEVILNEYLRHSVMTIIMS